MAGVGTTEAPGVTPNLNVVATKPIVHGFGDAWVAVLSVANGSIEGVTSTSVDVSVEIAKIGMSAWGRRGVLEAGKKVL